MVDTEDVGELASDVGRRLLRVRNILSLLQSEMAEAAGLSQPRYNAYETGKRLLTLKAAFLLCQKYSLTLDFLYMGDPSGLPYRLAEQLRDAKKAK